MKTSHALRVSLVILAAGAWVRPAFAQFATVGKGSSYTQTGPSAIVASSSQPYQFQAEVEGTASSPSGPISVTLPGGGGARALSYNSDSQKWRLRQNYDTQAAMDAAFPNGTYALAFGGKTINLALNGDLYPNAPIATVSAGTWTAAGLTVDPTLPLTVTINFTQNFLSGFSHLAVSASGGGQNLPQLDISTDDSGLSLDKSQVTLTIPANSFRAGGTYTVDLEANRLTALDTTTASPYTVVGIYSANVSIPIVVAAAPVFTGQSQGSQSVTVGGTLNLFSQVSNSSGVTFQWQRNGVNIAGATNSNLTISNVQSGNAGSYTVIATNAFGSTTSSAINVTVLGPPTVTQQPASQTATAGGNVTLTIAATGTPPPTFQWRVNGNGIANANAATLNLTNVQPVNAGLYYAVATGNGSTTSDPAIVGISLAASTKVIGAGSEISANIPHPNGNIFDQILAQGSALSFTADAGQVTRMSFIDSTDDITQIEFSGAGTVSVVFDNPTGPNPPVKYNQPTVSYMKGHAGILITGANETTNMSVFTVGRATAFDPTGGYNILLAPSATNVPANNGSSLFVGQANTTYDGLADIAFVAISSTNGKFGGLRTSNASYFATKGFTGVYAPGVEFTGPLFIGDLSAFDQATPMIMIGSCSDTRITGGDLLQANNQSVRVSGLTQLKFTIGSDSHGHILDAKNNRAVLIQNGTDVTNQIVVNPGP